MAFNTSQLLKSCFAAGTPLLTAGGFKLIETITTLDLVLAAPENDPTAPPQLRRVMEVFHTTAALWDLRVGGKLIRTTAEHPFYVRGKDWVPAKELLPGDLLMSHDGQWTPVESVADSGEEAPVYNLRVEGYHTYFVGSPEWGFSVWAHNACNLNTNAARSNFGIYEIKVNRNLYKVGKADLARITKSSGLPTRLHQQLRKLSAIFGIDNVVGEVVVPLGKTTTGAAKAAESALLQAYYEASQWVPLGNWKSFRPLVP